jgi:hypothetical protein
MKTTLLFLSVLLSIAVRGQEMPYTLTVLNEPYVPLSEAISAVNNSSWDDPDAFIPIGFTFQFIDEVITQIYLTGPGGQFISVAAEDSLNFLAPYIADLIDMGYDTASYSPIRYSVEGPPGYQVFKLEYSNAGFYDELMELGTTTNYVNFQMWFYQGSNVIEYRYGPNNVPNGASLHFFGGPIVGIGTGAPNGGGWENFWLLGGDPEAPEVNNYNDPKAFPVLLNSEPADSTVYRFSPTFVDVSENSEEAIFKIYPTVTDNSVQLILKQNNATAHIYNSVGVLVKTIALQRGLQTVQLNDLSAGSYIITIQNEYTRSQQKFVKY